MHLNIYYYCIVLPRGVNLFKLLIISLNPKCRYEKSHSYHYSALRRDELLPE